MRQLWQRPRGHALQRRLLERRLLMAVSPWVGDIILPCAPQRPTAVHTRADSIRAQLQDAHLASTPVFTLFIQLFQIDTTGCMEVVQERKAQLPTLPQAGAQVSSSAQNAPGCLLSSVPAREGAKKGASHRGSGGLQTFQAESASQVPLPTPCSTRPKPKTVSELLREKRLREARASKATQAPVVLPPQLLVSSPVILQPPLPLASQGPIATGPVISKSALSASRAPAAASPSTSSSSASATEKGPPALQALALTPISTVAAKASAASSAPDPGASQVPVSCHLNSLGQCQAPATSWKQGLPEAPPLLPAAPSPAQLPVQPLSLTPALGTQRSRPHMAANTPLPVTWVLTAQGLLPVSMPAVVGLPRPAGTPDPKGLSVTLSPSLTETLAGQGPASTDTESGLPSKTDHKTLLMPPPSQIPAEVDGDMVCAPGGVSSPGEAQVTGATTSQAAVLADHPEAESPQSSQLPPHCGAGPGNSPGRTLVSPSDPGETRAPLELERPPPPQLGPGKGALDLSLLSQENETTVREWLRGQRGVHVLPLGSRLPYQPPALCNLRALSRLLLHKKTLEHRAASLVPGEAAEALQASLGRVRRQLQDSPAYLLLKARFLAAFTLPALLATLPPRGVCTTLSAAMRADPGSEEDDQEELELLDGDRQPGCWVSGRPQAGPVATAPVQGAPDSGKVSAPSFQDDSDDFDVLRTRHGRHVRKRRRLL